MRKFNLKGTVVQRMRGIEREEPETTRNEQAEMPESPEMNAGFLPEQGLLEYAWRTDVGRLRKNNQDTVILGNGLAGVADGMGGHKGGEIASAGLRDGLLRETKDRKPDKNVLTEAVSTVNYELWKQQESYYSLTGMGTTLTVLWPSEKEMIIAQVGDSRAYLLRNGKLAQITNDHSMVADMVRKGVLTEEQAACHPMRNYITRAVGTESSVETDIYTHYLEKDDRWLICSDGLHGMIPHDRICEILSCEQLEEAADTLLGTALANGGKDNISFVIVQDNSDTVLSEMSQDDDLNQDASEGDSPEEVKPQ